MKFLSFSLIFLLVVFAFQDLESADPLNLAPTRIRNTGKGDFKEDPL
jgi:hypothetical protein